MFPCTLLAKTPRSFGSRQLVSGRGPGGEEADSRRQIASGKAEGFASVLFLWRQPGGYQDNKDCGNSELQATRVMMTCATATTRIVGIRIHRQQES